jgi:hypothetical protein
MPLDGQQQAASGMHAKHVAMTAVLQQQVKGGLSAWSTRRAAGIQCHACQAICHDGVNQCTVFTMKKTKLPATVTVHNATVAWHVILSEGAPSLLPQRRPLATSNQVTLPQRLRSLHLLAASV